MQKIQIDFHGINLEDAITKLQKLIDSTRLNSQSLECRLIVGHGIIRREFILLLENYDIEYIIPNNNSGIIVAFIE